MTNAKNGTDDRKVGSYARYARTILILAILAVFTSAASLTLSRDLLVRYQTQAQLQAAADSAAAAGAAWLPAWPQGAIRAATLMAERSGVRDSEIVTAAAAGNGMSFKVSLRRPAPVILLGLIGYGRAEVTVVATMPARALQPAGHDGLLVGVSDAGNGASAGQFWRIAIRVGTHREF
jgi:hypothetical protein